MTYAELNDVCGSLPATTYARQWGGCHVWKVGGKVFAIGGWNEEAPGITFKVSRIAFEILKDQPGLRPAPYLASRGLTWVQQWGEPGLEHDFLVAHLRTSYDLVFSSLTRKTRRALSPGDIAHGIGSGAPGAL